MYPRTPYPVSARNKSRTRDTVFCEITTRANAVSKSEQDFPSAMRKEEVTGKPAKTVTASRRYSVASKFAGSKFDNANAPSSGICAGESRSKIKNRASLLGTTNRPSFNGTSTDSSLSYGKSELVPASKKTTNRPAAPSSQEINLGSLPKRQSVAPEQAIKLQKTTLDLSKRSMSGNEKAESMQTTHAHKARGMLLKSAHYWLEQVKLAEAMEKHGVSVGFFRLAVECEAEPVELLKEELIAYIKRHSLLSNATQQLLLCYGITDEAQYTLFSQLSANCIIDSSPCTPAKNLEGMLSSNKDLAGQVSGKDLDCSETVFDYTISNNAVEESNIKEDALQSRKSPVPDASGHIQSMDADSVTREVVSCIMSSLKPPDGSKNIKNDGLAGPKDSFILAHSEQNNLGLSASLVAKDPVICVQESISVSNSADPEEATSTGSLPSLNVWNTFSKEVDTGNLNVQEEVSIALDNDLTDSASIEKLNGDDMCVSMELDVDDATSENQSDLQSKSPSCQGASFEEANCHASQTANKICEIVVKASDVQTANEICEIVVEASDVKSSGEVISADNYEVLPKISSHEESYDKLSEMVQGPGECENGSHEGQKIKSRIPKFEVEKSTTLQSNTGPESQGNRRRSSSVSGSSQNGKAKTTPASHKKKAEIPAPKKDNEAASVSQNSRRRSISTPKSSTSAYVPNIEAGSRTRRKPRISQFAETSTESNCMPQKSPIAPEGILATPRQEKTVEVGEGSKQVSLNTGMDGGTTVVMGSMATPGSAGLRRSARLMRPSRDTPLSTPGFVSSHVQRQLGTLLETEKEVV